MRWFYDCPIFYNGNSYTGRLYIYSRLPPDGQHKQDRRWNADKPSAALDPYIPTWLTTSPANHRPANFWSFFLNIEMKLWKVVQPQVQLMSINITFEVPILWLFQVQIITNIIY